MVAYKESAQEITNFIRCGWTAHVHEYHSGWPLRARSILGDWRNWCRKGAQLIGAASLP